MGRKRRPKAPENAILLIDCFYFVHSRSKYGIFYRVILDLDDVHCSLADASFFVRAYPSKKERASRLVFAYRHTLPLLLAHLSTVQVYYMYYQVPTVIEIPII